MPQNDEQFLKNLADISTGEFKLCLVVWENGSISSSQLIKECAHRYQWSKSTVYTYIRRLIGKGVLENNRAIIRLLVSKEDVQSAKIEYLIENTFEGSYKALFSMLMSQYHNSKG